MIFNKNIWWRGLRGCLYCGSLRPQPDGLCAVCAEELWKWSPGEHIHNQSFKKFEAMSLFEWIPGQQEVLSKLTHALKGSVRQDLWQRYSEEFWRRMVISQREILRAPLVLIPSPGQNLCHDHAASYTQYLADLSGATIYPCLQRERLKSAAESTAQKDKTRSQRFRQRFEWRENFSKQDLLQLSRDKTIIFVDDIVTTGATAHAAWLKLGRPREFAVWCLAQRSLLATEEGI